MSWLRFGYVAAPLLGALWTFVIAVTVAVAMSFATGEAFRPQILLSLVWGAAAGVACLALPGQPHCWLLAVGPGVVEPSRLVWLKVLDAQKH